jgi:hypothetical protein
MMFCPVCLLTACAGSGPSIEAGNTQPVSILAKPVAQPPSRLAADCASPADLPDDNKGLSAGQIEREWAQDRVNLVDCRDRHHGLVQFYSLRDRKLAGK